MRRLGLRSASIVGSECRDSRSIRLECNTVRYFGIHAGERQVPGHKQGFDARGAEGTVTRVYEVDTDGSTLTPNHPVKAPGDLRCNPDIQ